MDGLDPPLAPNRSIRHKARLVIKGYMQSDWGETYAPVGKFTTSRYLASLATGYGLATDHMDVVTTFLNPHVDGPELCMEIPKGWDSGNDGGNTIGAGTIIRLNKALYGLKQAPRLWYKDIDTFLQSLSFTQSRAGPSLYIYREGTALVLLLLYVNDISMACPRNAVAVVKNIKAKLADKYRITNLGTARQFLGIEITSGIAEGTNRHTISLGQRAFIDPILKRFRMENAHGAATPMDVNVKLDLAKDGEERKADPTGYQAFVGSLMCVALAARPDISFAVSALSRYNSCPLESNLTATKRVLRFLKSTAHHRLHFSSEGDSQHRLVHSGSKGDSAITGYTDSDWANNSTNRKSQGG